MCACVFESTLFMHFGIALCLFFFFFSSSIVIVFWSERVSISRQSLLHWQFISTNSGVCFKSWSSVCAHFPSVPVCGSLPSLSTSISTLSRVFYSRARAALSIYWTATCWILHQLVMIVYTDPTRLDPFYNNLKWSSSRKNVWLKWPILFHSLTYTKPLTTSISFSIHSFTCFLNIGWRHVNIFYSPTRQTCKQVRALLHSRQLFFIFNMIIHPIVSPRLPSFNDHPFRVFTISYHNRVDHWVTD